MKTGAVIVLFFTAMLVIIGIHHAYAINSASTQIVDYYDPELHHV
jgi:cellobiose-specific phosphotransferase system component IIC